MPSTKGLPPVTRYGRPSPWPEWAEKAMETPHVAILVGENLPTSQVNSARQLLWPESITSQGKIEVNLRNSSIVDGKRRGDLYFTFIPKRKRSR